MLWHFHVLEMSLVELSQTSLLLLCPHQICILYTDIKPYESCNLKISCLFLLKVSTSQIHCIFYDSLCQLTEEFKVCYHKSSNEVHRN